MRPEARIRYYLGAAEFWREAVGVQSERCIGSTSDPTLARVDLNFYVVAVQRLVEVATRARDQLRLAGVRPLLKDFDARWPYFRELRNSDEHIKGPKGRYPSGIWYFKGKAADCKLGGSSETLVNVEQMDAEIEVLFQGLRNHLRTELARLTTPCSRPSR